LIELMIASGMTVVVMALGFTALQSSSRSMGIASAEEAVLANVRDAMADMTRELELASKRSRPPAVEAIAVSDQGRRVTFQVPTDTSGDNWSAPITYEYRTEDENNNGLLDAYEQDEDGDGVLTRRIVRTQDGEERPIGGANDLSDVMFDFEGTGDALTVTLAASKNLKVGDDYHLSRATVSSRVRILN